VLCESHHELAHVYEKSGDYGAFRRKGTLVRATEAMITDVRAGLVPVPVGRPASRAHAARTVSARPAKRTECKSCPARAGWRRPTIGRAATRQWDRAVQQTARSSGLKDENGYGDCPDMTTHRATAVRTCHCCARVIRVNCGGGASNPS